VRAGRAAYAAGVPWQIYATAQTGTVQTGTAHATLYLVPGGGVNLRAQRGEELLLDAQHATLQDALIGAALSGLPQPLYDALLDAVARRAAQDDAGDWTPDWPAED